MLKKNRNWKSYNNYTLKYISAVYISILIYIYSIYIYINVEENINYSYIIKVSENIIVFANNVEENNYKTSHNRSICE